MTIYHDLLLNFQSEVSKIYEMADRGVNRKDIYESDEFAVIAFAIREKNPNTKNKEILKEAVRYFSQLLRCV